MHAPLSKGAKKSLRTHLNTMPESFNLTTLTTDPEKLQKSITELEKNIKKLLKETLSQGIRANINIYKNFIIKMIIYIHNKIYYNDHNGKETVMKNGIPVSIPIVKYQNMLIDDPGNEPHTVTVRLNQFFRKTTPNMDSYIKTVKLFELAKTLDTPNNLANVVNSKSSDYKYIHNVAEYLLPVT